MFEQLKKNIEQEKEILIDIKSIVQSLESERVHKDFFEESLEPLFDQLRMLNDIVPDLLKESSQIKEEDEKKGKKKEKKSKEIVKISYVSKSKKEKKYITLNKKDKKEFLKKLKLSEENFKNIKKIKENQEIALKPNPYATFANKLFRSRVEFLARKMTGLSSDLKRGNVRFMAPTYISMAILSMLIAGMLGILTYAVLLLLNTSNWTYIWVPILLPSFVFAGFYLYPSSEASTVVKKITQELPFATIYMAAVAGSNIEPTKILKIIAESREYKNIGIEMKKVLVQVEIYGFDLVTSLKNVASRTPNKQLSEVFSGIASNISTGGDLKTFLEKKAENFLLDYKLERQKFSELAGTFMDIYISILIAAPLVLMMMFIIMNVAGLGLGGLSINLLLILSILAIIVVNIIFLVVLNIKQPRI